jgi:hypothetical protein
VKEAPVKEAPVKESDATFLRSVANYVQRLDGVGWNTWALLDRIREIARVLEERDKGYKDCPCEDTKTRP